MRALLAGTDQERLGVVLVAVVGDLHHHARLDDAVVLRGHPHLRVAHQFLELPDPGFLLRLLVARRVVAAVLLEVALFPAGVDLRRENRSLRDQRVQLRLEPVVGFLGQPDLSHVTPSTTRRARADRRFGVRTPAVTRPILDIRRAPGTSVSNQLDQRPPGTARCGRALRQRATAAGQKQQGRPLALMPEAPVR